MKERFHDISSAPFLAMWSCSSERKHKKQIFVWKFSFSFVNSGSASSAQTDSTLQHDGSTCILGFASITLLGRYNLACLPCFLAVPDWIINVSCCTSPVWALLISPWLMWAFVPAPCGPQRNPDKQQHVSFLSSKWETMWFGVINYLEISVRSGKERHWSLEGTALWDRKWRRDKTIRCFHLPTACMLQIADMLLSLRCLSHNLPGTRMSGIVNSKEVRASHFHRQALFIAD